MIGRPDLMRRRSSSFFQHTAQLLAYTKTEDADGNPQETWEPGASFPCDLQDRGAVEAQEGGRLVSRTTWHAYAGLDAPGTAKDRLRIAGATYEITETNRARQGAVTTFFLERLGAGEE